MEKNLRSMKKSGSFPLAFRLALIIGFAFFTFSEVNSQTTFKTQKPVNAQAAVNSKATNVNEQYVVLSKDKNGKIQTIVNNNVKSEAKNPEKKYYSSAYPKTGNTLQKSKTKMNSGENPVGKLSVINEKWQKGGEYAGYTPAQEVLEKRTRVAKHFDNGDGTFAAFVGSVKHYKDENGAWQDIDYTIVPNSGEKYLPYKYQNCTNEIKSFFSEKPGDNGIVMQYENRELNFWKNPGLNITNSKGEIISSVPSDYKNGELLSSTIKYGTFDGIYDEFVIQEGGIENNIIVENLNNNIANSGGEHLEFKQFIPLAAGDKVKVDSKVVSSDFEAHSFVIEKDGNSDGFVFNPIVIFDSKLTQNQAFEILYTPNGKQVRPELSALTGSVTTGTYKVRFVNGGIEVYSVVSLIWMQNTDRTFPVTVDPTITIGTGSSSQRHPWGMFFGYERSAALYTNAEIGSYGIITTIAWEVAGSSTSAAPTVLYLKTQASNTITANTWASFISGAAGYNLGSADFTATGWDGWNLNYNYSSGNLLVLCETNYGGGGTSSYPTFYNSTYANQHAWISQDNSAPTGSLAVNSNRPNLGIIYTACTTPANNDCSGATTLTVNAAAVTGDVSCATQSIAAITCGGNTGSAEDDLWYKFTTTTAGTYKINVVGSSDFDAVVDLRSGACNGTNISCADATLEGGTETIFYSCAASTTYYIRVYDFYSSAPSTLTFTIDVSKCSTAPFAFNLTNPAADSIAQPGKVIVFKWAQATWADSYDVYIDGGLVDNVLPNTNLHLTFLEQGSTVPWCGAHTWYVVAKNTCGTTQSSSTRTFYLYPKFAGSTATALTPTTNCQSATGFIYSGNAYYYSFNATAGNAYYFGTANSTGDDLACGTTTPWDTYLRIYHTDGSCSSSAEDDEGSVESTNGNSRIAWTCDTSGTYYVQVIGYNSDIDSGTFYLQYKYKACSDPCAGVSAMTLGNTYTGTVGTTCDSWNDYPGWGWYLYGDETVYSFTPATTGNYTFTGTLTSSNGDPDFMLMSSCGNTGTQYGGWDNGNLTFTLTAGVTYYVIVDNFSTTFDAAYSLSVNECTSPPENDNCSAASYAALTTGVPHAFTGDGQCAGIDPNFGGVYPEVWISFNIPYCMNVKIEMCGNSPVHKDAYLSLFSDCSYSTIYTSTWDTTNCVDHGITLYWTNLSAGTYYYPVLIEPGWEASYTATVTGVSIISAPVSVLATPSTICSGSTITLSATAGSGGDQVVWFTGGCGVTPADTGTSVSVSPSSTTTFYASTYNSTSFCYSPCVSVPVTVSPDNTITLTTGGSQSVNVNTPITTTTYTTTGATGASVTGLPNGVAGNWVSNTVTISGTPTESGTFNYTVTLTGGCGTVTATGTITVIFVASGHSISGKTRYVGKANNGTPPTYDPAQFDIDLVIVILKDQSTGNEIARDTSDASGVFQFNNIPDGNYILAYDKYTADTMQWVNDANAFDVALIKYRIGSDSTSNPSRYYSNIHKKAADINNDNDINALDVAKIKAKIGSPYDPGKNFKKGNWVALDTLISVAGSNLNITLKTISYGDYNASSNMYRDSLITWSLVKSFPVNIIQNSDDYIVTSNYSYFELPLRISAKVNDFTALGLELSYPASEYRLVSAFMPNNNKGTSTKINPSLEEIIADDNDLLVTDENGVIRVVYATTNHVDVDANEEIIILGFEPRVEMSSGLLDFSLGGTGVIGDQYNERPDAYLIIPKIFVQNNSEIDNDFEFSGYPNPFNGEAKFSYNLPENGLVKLNVYNAIGEVVSEIVNESQNSGKHTVVFSIDDLPSNLYTFRLEFTGSGKTKSLVLKMIH